MRIGRRGGLVPGIAIVAALLVVGCGSGSGAATTSSATSAAPTSAATSADASGATDVSTPSPTTTVGGAATTLDAQSTTWFDTMCTGMAPLADLRDVDSKQELSDAMTAAGQAFQQTGAQLATIPPPTFEGGEELAQTAQTGLQSFGQTFIDFGQRVLEIADGDTAAQEQFKTDLEQAAADSPVAQLQLTPDLAEQVRAIPSCRSLFGNDG